MSNLDVLEHIFSKLPVAPQAAVLDVGCRNADALLFLKSRFGLSGKLFGVDRRDKHFIPAGQQKSLGIKLLQMDAALPLKFADESFDLIFHKDMLECIPDIPAHIRDLHRLLKPGGVIVCIHRDWETIAFNGNERAIINKAVSRYANYLQSGWMDSCDGWAGRRLWGHFNSSRLFDGRIECFSEIETEYREGTRGWEYIHGLADADQPDPFLTKEESEKLLADVEQAAEHGKYLFSSPFYIYTGVKR